MLVVDAEVTPEHVALLSGKSCLLLRRERRSALSRIGSNDGIDYPIRALQLRAWLRVNQAALLSSPTTRGYRLHRWPSTALLQGAALKIHMATLLSKSTLTPHSLAALVGQPEADCVQFIGQLKEAGVLRDAKAGVREIVKTSPLPDAAPVQRSLLGSIRRRLKEIWA